MSNTRIQIKRSSITTTPVGGSLAAAEPAYSYLSDKLFLGSSDGSGTIVVGGKFYIDQQNAVYDLVNAAFTAANAGFTDANSIYNLLNLTFNTTNSAYTLANANFDVTNAAYVSANANYVVTNAAFTVVNAAYTSANANYVVTNAAYTLANANFDVTNAAYVSANANYVVTNAAFDLANTKFASAGGTISGDVIVTGNLAVNGLTTYVDTETLLVKDPLIYLAANNGSDVVDIGFVGQYSNGTSNVFSGLFRSAGDKEYYLFQNYDILPGQNYIDPTGNNFSLAVLRADIITSNLTLNGANAYVWIKSNFDTTNAAYTLANANFDVTNAAYVSANANYVVTNAAFDVVNAAYTMANANFTVTNAAYTSVNAAYVVVNAAYTSSNAGYTVANAAFGTANTADQHAANASYVNTGTLLVNYGGTGRNTFTENGIIYGNGTDGLLVTSSGSEGNVLQVNGSGVPQFGMLDGGSF
jgi:hypothetical protein